MCDTLKKITDQFYYRTKHVDPYKLHNIFGVDWILDTDKHLWLLEINNGPDIKFYNKIVAQDLLKSEIKKLKNGINNIFVCIS